MNEAEVKKLFEKLDCLFCDYLAEKMNNQTSGAEKAHLTVGAIYHEIKSLKEMLLEEAKDAKVE